MEKKNQQKSEALNSVRHPAKLFNILGWTLKNSKQLQNNNSFYSQFIKKQFYWFKKKDH